MSHHFLNILGCFHNVDRVHFVCPCHYYLGPVFSLVCWRHRRSSFQSRLFVVLRPSFRRCGQADAFSDRREKVLHLWLHRVVELLCSFGIFHSWPTDGIYRKKESHYSFYCPWVTFTKLSQLTEALHYNFINTVTTFTFCTFVLIVDFRIDIDSTYFCLIPEPSWSKMEDDFMPESENESVTNRVNAFGWCMTTRTLTLALGSLWNGIPLQGSTMCPSPTFTLWFPWLRRLNTLLARVRRMWMWQLKMWQLKCSSPGHRGEDDGY